MSWWEWPLAVLVFIILLITAPVWIVALVMFGRGLDRWDSGRGERILVAIAERSAAQR